MQETKVFRIFIATPGDLGSERRELKEVVAELNDSFVRETDLRIELLGWEDTLPGAGRPQELINADLDKADLFIGCLWQRFGSPASDDGRTGFEEEFYRASERLAKTGSPEMWLFFKEIDAVRKADPGEQLQKVLSFRAQVITERKFLFCDLSAEKPWRDQVRKLLMRQVIKLMTIQGQPRPVATTPQPASDSPTIVPQGSKTQTAALSQVISLLRKVGSDIEQSNFANTSPAEIVRLSLFAASTFNWGINPIEWGVHEINATYLHRRHLSIVKGERDFILRLTAFDSTFTKPGWFWAGKKFILRDFLAGMTSDRDVWIRNQAIELATTLELSLLDVAGGTVIIHLMNDPERLVRLSAFIHITQFGTKKHLKLLDQVEGEPDEVNTVVSDVKHAILARANQTQNLIEILESGVAISDDGIAYIESAATPVDVTVIERTFKSPDSRLRAFAIRELSRRKAISATTLESALKDSSAVVREAAWEAAIATGAKIDPTNVRTSLPTKSIFATTANESDRSTVDSIVADVFRAYTNTELWTFVNRFDINSALALKALAGRATPADLVKVKTGLANGFEPKSDKPQKSLRLADILGDLSNTSHESNLREAALDVLVRHVTRDDRPMLLRLLNDPTSTPQEKSLCLEGLATVGMPEDAIMITQFLQDTNGVNVLIATKAFIKNSADFEEAVKFLLILPSEIRLTAMIEVANEQGISIWRLIKDLTNHHDPGVRCATCVYGAFTMARATLLKFLDSYILQKPYFYDVVFICDLFLYAPRSIKDLKLKQLFEKNAELLAALRKTEVLQFGRRR